MVQRVWHGKRTIYKLDHGSHTVNWADCGRFVPEMKSSNLFSPNIHVDFVAVEIMKFLIWFSVPAFPVQSMSPNDHVVWLISRCLCNYTDGCAANGHYVNTTCILQAQARRFIIMFWIIVMGKWCLVQREREPSYEISTPFFGQIIIFQTIRHTKEMRSRCLGGRSRHLSRLLFNTVSVCSCNNNMMLSVCFQPSGCTECVEKNINFSLCHKNAVSHKYVCSNVNNKLSSKPNFPFVICYRFVSESHMLTAACGHRQPQPQIKKEKQINERIYSWINICDRLCCQNNNIFIEFVMLTRLSSSWMMMMTTTVKWQQIYWTRTTRASEYQYPFTNNNNNRRTAHTQCCSCTVSLVSTLSYCCRFYNHFLLLSEWTEHIQMAHTQKKFSSTSFVSTIYRVIKVSIFFSGFVLLSNSIEGKSFSVCFSPRISSILWMARREKKNWKENKENLSLVEGKRGRWRTRDRHPENEWVKWVELSKSKFILCTTKDANTILPWNAKTKTNHFISPPFAFGILGMVRRWYLRVLSIILMMTMCMASSIWEIVAGVPNHFWFDAATWVSDARTKFCENISGRERERERWMAFAVRFSVRTYLHILLSIKI